MLEMPHAESIVQRLQTVFDEHERHREPAVTFEHPGPSRWVHAQAWAQTAVDAAQEAAPVFEDHTRES